MANLGALAQKYDKFVIFDTETTGLDFQRDEIIEFSSVVLERHGSEMVMTREYDNLVTLSPGNTVPPKITELTGISTQDIAQRGVAKAQVCSDIAEMFEGNTLLLAYNAHFDLSFLFYMLLRDGNPMILKGKDKLDLLTVYKDRRPFPHRLFNAIDSYGLTGKVVNSHRAIDDVLATVAVMEAMIAENDDLKCYVNLFGYNPKYGIDGKPIGSVTYKPQSFSYSGSQLIQPLYDRNL